jgi:integral membrane sensor domain MASE1
MVQRSAHYFSLKNFGLLAAVTLVYYFGGMLGLRATFVLPYGAPIWVPSGIALAACLLYGYRILPAVLVGSFFIYAARVGLDRETFLVPISSLLEAAFGAYLVNRFAGSVRAFDTARGVILFVLSVSILAPMFNPTIGVGLGYYRGVIPVSALAFRWLTWWLAHGMGSLLVAPFLILLLRKPRRALNRRELPELIALLLCLIFVSLLVFGPLSVSLSKNHVMEAWLCIPFLIWAGFRFSQLEAAGATLILFGGAIWGTLHGYGSFVAKNHNLMTSLVLIDTFIGVIGTMTLVVAAMAVERKKIAAELLGTQRLLREAVERKQRDLIVTVEALEMEASGHVQTKKALQDSQERLWRLADDISVEDEQDGENHKKKRQ